MVHGVTAVHGVAKSQIRLSDVTELNCMPRLLFPVEIHGTIPWVRAWQPTPAFLPGESRGQRSLVGCRLWGRTELDTTEMTQQQQQQQQSHYEAYTLFSSVQSLSHV